MRQKTMFKIIILALCLIVLFFVFDKDSDTLVGNNNINKNDLAFKYDKNDDRLESLVDVINNNENVAGRVLVFNPNPIFPSFFDGECFDETMILLNEYDDLSNSFSFVFSCENPEKVALDMWIMDCNFDSSFYTLHFIRDVNNGIYYEYLPYFVLPSNATKILFAEDMLDIGKEKLCSILDEILLISKDSIYTQGDVY